MQVYIAVSGFQNYILQLFKEKEFKFNTRFQNLSSFVVHLDGQIKFFNRFLILLHGTVIQDAYRSSFSIAFKYFQSLTLCKDQSPHKKVFSYVSQYNLILKKLLLFYFLFLSISRESIVLGLNFRNGDFDEFTRFEVS